MENRSGGLKKFRPLCGETESTWKIRYLNCEMRSSSGMLNISEWSESKLLYLREERGGNERENPPTERGLRFSGATLERPQGREWGTRWMVLVFSREWSRHSEC